MDSWTLTSLAPLGNMYHFASEYFNSWAEVPQEAYLDWKYAVEDGVADYTDKVSSFANFVTKLFLILLYILLLARCSDYLDQLRDFISWLTTAAFTELKDCLISVATYIAFCVDSIFRDVVKLAKDVTAHLRSMALAIWRPVHAVRWSLGLLVVGGFFWIMLDLSIKSKATLLDSLLGACLLILGLYLDEQESRSGNPNNNLPNGPANHPTHYPINSPNNPPIDSSTNASANPLTNPLTTRPTILRAYRALNYATGRPTINVDNSYRSNKYRNNASRSTDTGVDAASQTHVRLCYKPFGHHQTEHLQDVEQIYREVADRQDQIGRLERSLKSRETQLAQAEGEIARLRTKLEEDATLASLAMAAREELREKEMAHHKEALLRNTRVTLKKYTSHEKVLKANHTGHVAWVREDMRKQHDKELAQARGKHENAIIERDNIIKKQNDYIDQLTGEGQRILNELGQAINEIVRLNEERKNDGLRLHKAREEIGILVGSHTPNEELTRKTDQYLQESIEHRKRAEEMEALARYYYDQWQKLYQRLNEIETQATASNGSPAATTTTPSDPAAQTQPLQQQTQNSQQASPGTSAQATLTGNALKGGTLPFMNLQQTNELLGQQLQESRNTVQNMTADLWVAQADVERLRVELPAGSIYANTRESLLESLQRLEHIKSFTDGLINEIELTATPETRRGIEQRRHNLTQSSEAIGSILQGADALLQSSGRAVQDTRNQVKHETEQLEDARDRHNGLASQAEAEFQAAQTELRDLSLRKTSPLLGNSPSPQTPSPQSKSNTPPTNSRSPSSSNSTPPKPVNTVISPVSKAGTESPDLYGVSDDEDAGSHPAGAGNGTNSPTPPVNNLIDITSGDCQGLPGMSRFSDGSQGQQHNATPQPSNNGAQTVNDFQDELRRHMGRREKEKRAAQTNVRFADSDEVLGSRSTVGGGRGGRGGRGGGQASRGGRQASRRQGHRRR